MTNIVNQAVKWNLFSCNCST